MQRLSTHARTYKYTQTRVDSFVHRWSWQRSRQPRQKTRNEQKLPLIPPTCHGTQLRPVEEVQPIVAASGLTRSEEDSRPGHPCSPRPWRRPCKHRLHGPRPTLLDNSAASLAAGRGPTGHLGPAPAYFDGASRADGTTCIVVNCRRELTGGSRSLAEQQQ